MAAPEIRERCAVVGIGGGGLRGAISSGAVRQYSSASMTVRTRVVTAGSAEGERLHLAIEIIELPEIPNPVDLDGAEVALAVWVVVFVEGVEISNTM